MELFELVRREMPNTVLATIYNNLNALEEMGEIRRLHIEGGTERYDKTLHPHAHLVCDKCGKIQDASVEGIDDAISKTVNAGINFYELNIHWNCAGCEK